MKSNETTTVAASNTAWKNISNTGTSCTDTGASCTDATTTKVEMKSNEATTAVDSKTAWKNLFNSGASYAGTATTRSVGKRSRKKPIKTCDSKLGIKRTVDKFKQASIVNMFNACRLTMPEPKDEMVGPQDPNECSQLVDNAAGDGRQENVLVVGGYGATGDDNSSDCEAKNASETDEHNVVVVGESVRDGWRLQYNSTTEEGSGDNEDLLAPSTSKIKKFSRKVNNRSGHESGVSNKYESGTSGERRKFSIVQSRDGGHSIRASDESTSVSDHESGVSNSLTMTGCDHESGVSNSQTTKDCDHESGVSNSPTKKGCGHESGVSNMFKKKGRRSVIAKRKKSKNR